MIASSMVVLVLDPELTGESLHHPGRSPAGYQQDGEAIGFRTQGVRITVEELEENVPYPAYCTGTNGISWFATR